MLSTFLSNLGLSSKPEPAKKKPAAPAAARRPASPQKSKPQQMKTAPKVNLPAVLKPEKSFDGAFDIPETQKRDERALPAKRVQSGRQIERITNPSKELIDEIFAFRGEVLTIPGGRLHVQSEQRKLVAVLDNGWMLISKSASMNHLVSAVRNQCKQHNIRIEREILVPLETIRRVTELAESLYGGNSSGLKYERQKEFMKIIRDAHIRGSSDVQWYLWEKEAIVRIRVDGAMATMTDMATSHAEQLITAAFNMADVSDTHQSDNDYQGARIIDDLPEGVGSLRLQFNPLATGRHLAIRILPVTDKSKIKDIDGLGYLPVHVEMFKQFRKYPIGMIIVSGPTGSGKSTTLQRSIVTQMEERGGQDAVITIEDPPEYDIPGAAQFAVANAQTEEQRNEAFRQAIAAALRSNPNIVLIGEMRDRASALLALSAVNTGHQVWTTLHTNSALLIPYRLRDLGVEDFKIFDHQNLRGLVGQRLVRQVCGHCGLNVSEARAKKLIDPDIGAFFAKIGNQDLSQVRFENPEGCPKCNKGHKGRTVVAEVAMPDFTLMELLREGRRIEAERYWQDEMNGLSMLDHGVIKILAGAVDPTQIDTAIGSLSAFDPGRLSKVMAAA